MVTLQGVEGEMGIYPQHVRLMTQLVPGEMVVQKSGRDDFLAVGDGLVEITNDRVAILTDMAVRAENIDEAKAEEARQRAAARLQEQLSSQDLASVNASLSLAGAVVREETPSQTVRNQVKRSDQKKYHFTINATTASSVAAKRNFSGRVSYFGHLNTP